MRKKFFGVVLAIFPTFVHAEAVNYKDVFRVDSHRIGEVVVRYIKLFSEPCLTIQALSQKPEWQVVSAKKICSFEGKSFKDEVADAQFEDIYFSEDGVHFTLSITPLRLAAEQRRACVVPVEQGVVGELVCAGPT
jgi:hypothetical protein